MSRRKQRQAFKGAPWRIDILKTSKTALSVVVLLILGGIYLTVNAKVARAGREVLVLESRRSELYRIHSELTATIAEIRSPERMLERAASLGFRAADSNEIQYLLIEGYAGKAPFIAPKPPANSHEGAAMLSPAYTETLGEWFNRWLAEGER
jgi:hypothetical protein